MQGCALEHEGRQSTIQGRRPLPCKHGWQRGYLAPMVSLQYKQVNNALFVHPNAIRVADL